MPTVITPYLALVWFATGLFVGAGWTLGGALISRLTR